MERQFNGSNGIKFEGNNMEQDEPWISPEPDDMKMFNLPCCNRKIKVEENHVGVVTCPFCGFPHNTE